MSSAYRLTALLAVLATLGTPARAQDSSLVRSARITYLTSASAYIDAGRDAGLQEGTSVQVMRAGAVIAVLKVSFLASAQAACEIVSETAALAVGDSVRFTVAALKLAAGDTTPAPRVILRTATVRSALHGRIGAHYLVLRGDAGRGFTQPSIDARLDGRPSAGSPFTVAMDVRARRSASTLQAGTLRDGSARAYQFALAWTPATTAARVTVGRQMVLAAPSLGIFDGVSAGLETRGWSAAVFGGTQPEPLRLSFATDIIEFGGYVERRGASVTTGRRWSATAGVSGSYQNAHANREFAFLQASFSSTRLLTFVSQEIDYYRPWKRVTGMPAVSPTSTFASLRYRANDAVTVRAGFDNRQNVLLYRDVVNPVTTFDDAYRQGVWAGMDLRLTPRAQLGVDVRRSSGGSGGSAGTYTLALGVNRVLGREIGLRGRSTYYHSRGLDGWLLAGTVAADPGRLHAELSGGARIERDPLALPGGATIRWVGTDLDLAVGRAWYLMFSGNVERGSAEATSQLYTGFSLRF